MTNLGRPTRLLTALALASLGAPGAVHAQDIAPVVDSSWMNDMAMGSAMMDAAKGTSDVITRASPSTGSRASSAADLSFTPSMARRRANLASFVAKTRARDRASADRMAATFASNDVIGMVDGMMRKVGLRANNLADAYAVYWTNAWLGSRGRNEDLPASQMQAVRRQAAAAITSTPEFADATDATKQEMAEAMLVQAVMISGAVDMAKERPSLMPKVRDSIARGAKSIGLDVRSMTLTSGGFRPGRRSDADQAIEAANGDAPAALAASAQASESSDDAGEGTATYALIAAGGAGLAAMFMMGRAAGRRG